MNSKNLKNRRKILKPIPGIYDIKSLGWNYRMSEGHAAVGLIQLNILIFILIVTLQEKDSFHSLIQI
mgnify:CR=1 FL=1